MRAENRIVLLGDFGATHLRLALLGDAGPEQLVVYAVREWPGIDAAMRDYAVRTGRNWRGATFYLAHTGHVADGALALDYKAERPWSFRLEDVARDFSLAQLIAHNDLKAAACAVLADNGDAFQLLRAGVPRMDSDSVVIGVGTGTGHAYVSHTNGAVRETFGAHFPPAAVTDRQRAVLDHVRAGVDPARTMIIEDILSGAGLLRVYRALAEIDGKTPCVTAANDLLAQAGSDPLVRESTSLFCEFLGLHAHILCNAAAAYGGIYLCGGMVERLNAGGLFDAAAFTRNLHQAMVPVVARALESLPLYIAAREHTPLYGLAVCARGGVSG
ncbi:MAG: glucokinase [Rhodospirillales bacterium]|nr:glucokinase [Alphaproteobacteria bacterium]MCB9986391.1 glucokinase [Rhodospirillales bacterium]USO07061.1 MAG: glucokinase [Rhodospirillales bacterium]